MTYPAWWDSTITLYNRYVDETTQVITWYRTVLSNCFWSHNENRMVVGDTVIESNNLICRIPENSDYLDKSKWVELPNDEMSNYFTFGIEDIVLLGEITDGINEYVKGSRSTDLIAKYKGFQKAMQIKEFTDNTGILRCMPHYYIQGE